MSSPETIRTERLLLRPHTLEDAPEYARLISEWDVMKMLTSPPHPFRLAHAQEYLGSLRDVPWSYAITRDGAMMGNLRIGVRLGFWLGKPHWGQGYMTEAVAALIDTYFDSTNADGIESGVFPDNPASRGVHAKLGFHETGTHREHSNARGGEVDLIGLRLDRTVWENRADWQNRRAGNG